MTDLSKGRVIITYGRSLMALTAAQSLARRGVEVIGADDVNFNALSYSKWSKKNVVHAKATGDPDAFIDDLERIVIENRPSDDRPYVLMPMFQETKLLSSYAERFTPHIKLAVPPIEGIHKIHPKDAMARTARCIGLSVPTSIACATEADAQAASREVSYPCLVKPADAVGGRGITKADGADALLAAWRDIQANFPNGDPVVQEFATGDDFCYCFLAIDGTIVADSAYRNLVRYPADYGAGVVRETVQHLRLREIAAPLIRETNWSGVGEIDFMWSGHAADLPVIIELNPRFWANLDHSVSSGVDFPWLLYEATVTGAISETPDPTIGYRSKLPGLWLLAALDKALDVDGNEDGRSLEDAFSTIYRNLRSGHVPEALRVLTQSPGSGLDLREAFRTFRETVKDAEEIETIAADQDDPFVGLGIFFVLGHLLRYRELPRELRR